jgi:RNA polymerase sigma factor (sigma-70 family)
MTDRIHTLEGIDLSDDELVDRLRAGDPEALGTLFDEHADRIYNFCFRRTASWALAEDAMSAVFLEVWRIRDRATTHDGAVLPWLYGVATNVCRNTARTQRRQHALQARLPRAADHADHADEVADRVDDEHRMARLLAALRQLSPRDQQVLTLVVWDGLTYEQAAAALDVPVGTVRSRLSRSRQRLTELLAQTDSHSEQTRDQR